MRFILITCKLKRDINDYETRLEAVLEDASRKEKTVDSLLEESKLIKKINQSLEMQVGMQETIREVKKKRDQRARTSPQRKIAGIGLPGEDANLKENVGLPTLYLINRGVVTSTSSITGKMIFQER